MSPRTAYRLLPLGQQRLQAITVEAAIGPAHSDDLGQPEAQRLCLADQQHQGEVLLAVVPVAVDAWHRGEQAPCFVQADGFLAGAAAPGDIGDAHGQSRTSPPSTTRFWPVIARAHGEAKNSAASANSAGVVTLRSGVLAAM